MRPPPPVTQIARYPISGGLCLLAIGVTVYWMTGHSIGSFVVTGLHLLDQPWRTVTSIFPHVNILHLAFNVYWTWVFGTLLEREFGQARFLLMVLILAAGSSAAEFAVLEGGVGLSGVGYGLFGMLWVLSRFDARFAGAIDARTIQTFVIWFVLCIILTVARVMLVANMAHGAGAILGAILGWLIVAKSRKRAAPAGVLALLVAVISLSASVLRPYVNMSPDASAEYVDAGCDLLREGKPREAIPLLRKATQFRLDRGFGWYNLGVAYDLLGQTDEATACFQRAVEEGPGEADFRQALKERRGDAAGGAVTRVSPD